MSLIPSWQRSDGRVEICYKTELLEGAFILLVSTSGFGKPYTYAGARQQCRSYMHTVLRQHSWLLVRRDCRRLVDDGRLEGVNAVFVLPDAPRCLKGDCERAKNKIGLG